MQSYDLTHVGILVHRKNSAGETELFVRFVPSAQPRVYYTPYAEGQPGESDIDCAVRVARTSIGMEIPKGAMENYPSFSIADKQEGTGIRVFMIPARHSLNDLTTREIRG
jgi:hypothetical protein